MTQVYPSYTAVTKDLRDVASRLSRYLVKSNGNTILERVLEAVAKPLEELQEVLFEMIADPDLEAVAMECADVIIAASTAQATLGWSPKASAIRIRAELTSPEQRTAAVFRLALAVAGLGARGILWTGQNPRKVAQGESASDADMSIQLDRVILAAAELISAAGFNVAETVSAVLAKVNARLDTMEVEPRAVRPDEQGADPRTAARIHAGSTFWPAMQARAKELGVEMADVVDERFLATINQALYEIAEAGQGTRR